MTKQKQEYDHEDDFMDLDEDSDDEILGDIDEEGLTEMLEYIQFCTKEDEDYEEFVPNRIYNGLGGFIDF